MWKKKGKRSQRAVALGLAHGLSQIEAVKQAGYADSTAKKKAYRIVQRPQIQNFLTEALEALGVTAKKIMQPIVDGLEAREVVRSKDGDILADDPDHRVRLQAHDRAVALYGLGKGAEHPAPGLDTQPSPTYNIQVNFVSPKDREATPLSEVSSSDSNSR
ncbi:MAG: hypothetical protein V3S25_09435 [Nitrospirales bacterium]